MATSSYCSYEVQIFEANEELYSVFGQLKLVLHASEAKDEPPVSEVKDELPASEARRHFGIPLVGLAFVILLLWVGLRSDKPESFCTTRDDELAKYKADTGWERDTPAERRKRFDHRPRDIRELKLGEYIMAPEELHKLRCYRKLRDGAVPLSPSEREASNPDNWEQPELEPQRF